MLNWYVRLDNEQSPIAWCGFYWRVVGKQKPLNGACVQRLGVLALLSYQWLGLRFEPQLYPAWLSRLQAAVGYERVGGSFFVSCLPLTDVLMAVCPQLVGSAGIYNHVTAGGSVEDEPILVGA